MPLVTTQAEQQKLRQDIKLIVEGVHSELNHKYTSVAVQSSVTFAVSSQVEQIKKTMGQQKQELSSLKRTNDKTAPAAGSSGGTTAKRSRTSGDRKRPAWTQLKQDASLHFCGAFDKEKRQQCGWNSTHHWGPDCPVKKSNPDYKPRYWGPQEAGWEEPKALTNVPIAELKPLYNRDVQRWITANRK